MSSITFNEALEDIKSSGEVEKASIEIANELARIIKELTETRISSGFTQRQLAQESGVKQSAIARMESLQAIPRLDTLVKVARCLNAKVTIDSSYSKKLGCVLIDFQKEREKSTKYAWSSTASISSNVSYHRKELDYAAIG